MSIDGVSKVEVDFASKKAIVTMKPGKSLSKETCDEAFQGSRYSVASFEAR